ncbi:hypothetical protein VTK26DRAFT_9524 [Humicola hyalothermophila]
MFAASTARPGPRRSICIAPTYIYHRGTRPRSVGIRNRRQSQSRASSSRAAAGIIAHISTSKGLFNPPLPNVEHPLGASILLPRGTKPNQESNTYLRTTSSCEGLFPRKDENPYRGELPRPPPSPSPDPNPSPYPSIPSLIPRAPRFPFKVECSE